MTNKTKTNSNEIMLIDENSIKDKIYVIRGIQVMLDFDLASIYGYETRYLNLQVKNNKMRFPSDFMFQLTEIEYKKLMLKNSTSSWGGNRKLPYAFSEQGIYQLATVLKGEVATKQSIAIMRAFKLMKDYLINTNQLTSPNYLYELTLDNTSKIKQIENTMITRNDLSDFLSLFDSGVNNEEILILNGQPFKADLLYKDILSKAKRNIIIVDDYINIKTLDHLKYLKKDVKAYIVSDNKAKLSLIEYKDFEIESKISIDFIKSNNLIHDRYICVDFDTDNMKLYHLGSSIKDTGNKLTSINMIKDYSIYKEILKTLLNNKKCILK